MCDAPPGTDALAREGRPLLLCSSHWRRELRSRALLQRLPTAESDRDREQNQAATWNSSAMKLAWARMSRLPMPRTCPFLIIAIAS